MSISTYTPSSAKFVHTTYVDMSNRAIAQPVHIVQYDTNLPILAVKLYNEGQAYTLSTDADVNIRVGKSDSTMVYNPAEGCNSDYNMVYFAMTKQMSSAYGTSTAVIEITIDDETACSSPITISVDKNPIQEDTICSANEYLTAKQYAEIAKQAADDTVEGVQAAVQSAKDAAASEENAKTSETNAAASEENAKTSETNAAASEENAKTSETNAAASEENAKTSETNAAASEENAKTSETNAAASEENAKTSETNAAASEENAKASETNADKYATLAESWAIGGTDSRDGEDTDNSKYYCELAKDYTANAKEYAVNASKSAINSANNATSASESEKAAADSAAAAAESESNAQKYAEYVEGVANITLATTTKVGIVKLTSADNITDTEGLAVAATELNPDIDGTLAYRIDAMETDAENFENYFYTYYTKVPSSSDVDVTAMTVSDITDAINTEWNGESTTDETAMSSTDVTESVETEWNGESSTDDTALSASDISNITT